MKANSNPNKKPAGERRKGASSTVKDIRLLCSCVDSLLDDMHDMCGSRDGEAEALLSAMRARYGSGERGAGRRA